MSVELRTRVRRTSPGRWLAYAALAEETAQTYSLIASATRIAESHPEALQAAYKLRADLERELMDEVHASRASRRFYKAACTEFPVTKPCDCQECEDARAFVEATA